MHEPEYPLFNGTSPGKSNFSFFKFSIYTGNFDFFHPLKFYFHDPVKSNLNRYFEFFSVILY